MEQVEQFIFSLDEVKVESKEQDVGVIRWAAFEILNRFLDHPNDSPIELIEEFILDMDLAAETSPTECTRELFLTAANTGRELELLYL